VFYRYLILVQNNKIYNASNIATTTGTAQLNGVISGETVSLGGTPLFVFADKNTGNNKSVAVSGYLINRFRFG
jgi:hypothetical protein